MSSSCLIVGKHSSFLISDGAGTMFGRLVRRVPKALTFPHLGCAITIRGKLSTYYRLASFIGGYRDQAEMLGNVERDLKRMFRYRPRLFGLNDFDIVIAGYDAAGRRPWGRVISNLERPGFEPFVLCEVEMAFATPAVSDAILEQAHTMATETRQAEEAAWTLTDAQRSSGIVGCFSQLTIVRETIETKIVKTYDQDEIGKKIIF
jgi:hypothetical protein